MTDLLVVCNTPSENLLNLKNAVIRGAQSVTDSSFRIDYPDPLQVVPQDVIDAKGIVIGTSENFGYMSGLIKDFFERIYYPCLELTQAKPVSVYVKGGLDGEGARTSIERILNGLRWKPVQPTLVMTGQYKSEFAEQCEALGAQIAAGLELEIY
ncbi:MAG: NAD(P)H-dependent oxidoreductase [Pseudomonadota bacterium]